MVFLFKLQRLNSREVAKSILSYGAPALVILVLSIKLVTVAVSGVPPVPQIPPDGYFAEEDIIKLYWRRGDHEGSFTVQVAENSNFSRPVFVSATDKTEVILPRLEPGKRYCWRVLKDNSAEVSCFVTSANFVPY